MVKLVIKKVTDKPTKQQKEWTPTSIVVNPKAQPENVDIVRKAKAYKYYGLKINEETLGIKNMTLMEVMSALDISTNYVIGRDEALSAEGKAHYHIHFKDERTLDALQKHKQRVLPNWGRTTKLYPPKDRVENIMCWYGYAVKEQVIHVSSEIDRVVLEQEAHTQRAFKQSQLNYGKNQQEKKDQKKDLETRLYDKLDEIPITYDFFYTSVWLNKFYRQETNNTPTRQQRERLVWNYLLTRGHKTDEDMVIWEYSSNKLST